MKLVVSAASASTAEDWRLRGSVRRSEIRTSGSGSINTDVADANLGTHVNDVAFTPDQPRERL